MKCSVVFFAYLKICIIRFQCWIGQSRILLIRYSFYFLQILQGKHVLCEKPLAMNVAEVSEMLDLATSKKVFFMEAIWSRTFPLYQRVTEIVDSKEIGEVRILILNFSNLVQYSSLCILTGIQHLCELRPEGESSPREEAGQEGAGGRKRAGLGRLLHPVHPHGIQGRKTNQGILYTMFLFGLIS